MEKHCKCGTCKTGGATCKEGAKKDKGAERISELYVGAFAIPLDGDVLAENIVIGIRYGVFQATVEHHLGAVPKMIEMCDEIARDKGWDWRLLRFGADGVQELDAEDYRSYESYCVRRSIH